MNFFSQVNIHCDKVGQGDRKEGKKDKDIIALTDRRHIKAPLLCLPATLHRKNGTKETKRREKERGNDKPAYLLLFHRWKSLVITGACLLSLFHSCNFSACVYTRARFLVFTHSISLSSHLSYLLTLFVFSFSASLEPPFLPLMLASYLFNTVNMLHQVFLTSSCLNSSTLGG